MARHPFIAGIAALLLAFAAAGCTGTSQQAQAPEPEATGVTDVGINISRGNGSDVSTEASDEEGAAESDTDEDAEETDTGKDASEPGSLACDLQRYAYGKVGEPFSLKLAATGGSGSYRFSLAAGQSLPEGLSLNQGAATVEGMPTKAGSFGVNLVVTDPKDNAHRDCRSIKLTIAKQDVKVRGLSGFKPPQLELEEQTLSKLPPTQVTQIAFGTMGGELMQEEEYDGFKLTLTICDNAEMAGDDCLSIGSAALKGIKRGRWTSTFLDLPEPFAITPEHRYVRITQVGKTGPYDVKAVHFTLLTEQGRQVYTYFNPCLEKRLYKGDSLLFGPDDTAICAVISTGDQEKAGSLAPVDLLVRLDKGLTKAKYKASYANNLLRWQRLGKNFQHALDSPHFSEVLERSADGTVLSYLVLKLEWRQLNKEDTGATYEFWNRRTVAFGDYLDFNPFNMSLSDHNVRLRIRPKDIAVKICADLMNTCVDTSENIIMRSLYEEFSKEWLLKGYEVYLFFPGKLNDREATRLLRAVEEKEQWILAEGAAAPDSKPVADVVIEKGQIFTMPTIPYEKVTGADQIGKILFDELLPLRW